MRKFSFAISGLLCCFFQPLFCQNTIAVNSLAELQEAIGHAQAGDQILLADGEYMGSTCKINLIGTEEAPIVIKAQNQNKAIIQSPLEINSDYISLIGLKFERKGYLVIQGKGCRVSQCLMSDVQNGKWIQVFPGSYKIEIDHNVFENKTINKELPKNCQLLQIRVLNRDEQHHIHHNIFRDIPQGSGNGFETLQLITKNNPFDPPPGACNTIIENNSFERCNGESEIISVKSNGNILRGNTFRASKGSLVLRHGDNNIVTGNFFFGDGEMGSGGVRIQGSGHIIANNYFHKLGQFGIGMMDGTPDDLYVQVEKAQIAFNTFVDCPKVMVIGLNHSKHPNGTTPKDCEIIGNLFFNKQTTPNSIIKFVQGDQPENWNWSNNIAYEATVIPQIKGIQNIDPKMLMQKKMLIPTSKTPQIKWDKNLDKHIQFDLSGKKWKKKKSIGAIQYSSKYFERPSPLNKKQ